MVVAAYFLTPAPSLRACLPAHPLPQIMFNTVYMFINVVVAAYILGTMTVLVVTGDEKIKAYRYGKR